MKRILVDLGSSVPKIDSTKIMLKLGFLDPRLGYHSLILFISTDLNSQWHLSKPLPDVMSIRSTFSAHHHYHHLSFHLAGSFDFFLSPFLPLSYLTCTNSDSKQV